MTSKVTLFAGNTGITIYGKEAKILKALIIVAVIISAIAIVAKALK